MKKLLHKILTWPPVSILLRKVVENNFKKQKEIIKKDFAAAPGERVLDVGCGTGEFSLFFPAGSYVGIDIDAANISYADHHFDRKFLVADGKSLPFENHCFDKVLVVGVFHHLSDADCQTVLLEIKRVLRPGGIFLVMEDTQSSNLLIKLLQYFDQGEFIRNEAAWRRIFSAGWSVLRNFTFRNGAAFYSAFFLVEPTR